MIKGRFLPLLVVCAAGLYGQAFRVMEVYVVNNTIDFTRPAGAFQTTFAVGAQPAGLLFRVQNLPAASKYRIKFVRPDLSIALDSGAVDTKSVAPPNDYSFIHWFTPNLTAGQWHISLEINGSLAASPQFEVIAPGATSRGLVHRYSFSNGATDSVGRADGKLMNGATVSNGALHLNGVNQYVALPAGIAYTSASATFEAWITWAEYQPAWARVWDFGTPGGLRDMFLTPRNGRLDLGPAVDTPRFAATGNGTAGEQQVTSASPLPVGKQVHVVVTMDGQSATNKLYIDGNLVATNTPIGAYFTPAMVGNTTNNWLGRSQWGADPYFKGDIAEFRIWDRALGPSEVATHFSDGPDQGIPAPAANGCGATDVSPQITFWSQGYIGAPPLNQYFTEKLQITNNGPAIAGPLYLVVRGLPTTASLIGVYPEMGMTTCYSATGDVWVGLKNYLTGGVFPPKATITVPLTFGTNGGYPSPHVTTLLAGKPSY